MLPSVMGGLFPGKGIEEVAELVEKAAVSIVDEAAE
jgi:hypothetical protein